MRFTVFLLLAKADYSPGIADLTMVAEIGEELNSDCVWIRIQAYTMCSLDATSVHGQALREAFGLSGP